MKQKVKLGHKGQVTLPSEVRKKLNLQEGAIFEVSVEDGRIVLIQLGHKAASMVNVSTLDLEILVGIVSLGGDAVMDSARYDQ